MLTGAVILVSTATVLAYFVPGEGLTSSKTAGGGVVLLEFYLPPAPSVD